jgi:hypothetical protein
MRSRATRRSSRPVPTPVPSAVAAPPSGTRPRLRETKASTPPPPPGHARAGRSGAAARRGAVARRRAARALRQPARALLAPVRRVVVAAVFGKFAELLPGHRLRVDLELGHRFVVRPLLARRHEAAARRPQGEALRGKPQRRAHRAQHALGQQATHIDSAGLRPGREAQQRRILLEQRGAKPMQRGIVLRRRRKQLQRGLERGFEIAAHGLRGGSVGVALRPPPRIGLRLDRRQGRLPRVGRIAARALHVARDPALLPPACAAGDGVRAFDAFEHLEPGQGAVARLHQGQRQQLAAGVAHRVGIVESGGRRMG